MPLQYYSGLNIVNEWLQQFSTLLDGLFDRLCAVPADTVFAIIFFLAIQSIGLLDLGPVLRFTGTVPLLLFLDGYAITSVLFPRRHATDRIQSGFQNFLDLTVSSVLRFRSD